MWIKKENLPFTYNIRSLLMRKGGSILTLTSIGLTVMVFAVMSGLSNGLETTYASTGRSDVLIALAKGAGSAEISRLSGDTLFTLKYHHAIRRRGDGSPLFSPEVYAIKPLLPPSSGSSEARWLPLRGLRLENMDLYPTIKIIKGRSPEGGQELLVGKLVSAKLGTVQVGDEIALGRQTHRVVGIFSANGTAYESEVWTSNQDLLTDFDIPFQSIAVFAIEDGEDPQAVIRELEDDPRIQVDVETEKDYFIAMAENYAFVRIIGDIIAFVMSVGALFAGMNTMYTSVSSRVREIGTLRALGFSRRAIQLSFILESLLLGALAGVLGSVAALIFNGASLSFMRSAFHIQINALILLQAFALALVVGFLGGYFPARSAARMKIVDVMNA